MSRTKSEWPIVERRDVELHMLRDVGRQDLDLELAERVVEHAAEVAHAVGNAGQVDRHLEGDLLVGAYLVEIEMQDLGGAERVALDLADQRLDRGRPSTTTSRTWWRR